VDIDSRLALYQHIVISGGSTMYPGLPTRLEREMRQLYSERVLQVGPRRAPGLPTARRWLRPAVRRLGCRRVCRGPGGGLRCALLPLCLVLYHTDVGATRPDPPPLPLLAPKGRQPGAVKLRLKVEDPPGRRHMVFLGGSVLADIMKVTACLASSLRC
jgi:actin-related protein